MKILHLLVDALAIVSICGALHFGKKASSRDDAAQKVDKIKAAGLELVNHLKSLEPDTGVDSTVCSVPCPDLLAGVKTFLTEFGGFMKTELASDAPAETELEDIRNAVCAVLDAHAAHVGDASLACSDTACLDLLKQMTPHLALFEDKLADIINLDNCP